MLGTAYDLNVNARRPLLLGLGVALVMGFVALRYWNHYGDELHWRVHDTALFTVLSFMDTSEYPPSLQFLLMTLGPALLCCAPSTAACRDFFTPHTQSGACRCSSLCCTST